MVPSEIATAQKEKETPAPLASLFAPKSTTSVTLVLYCNIGVLDTPWSLATFENGFAG